MKRFILILSVFLISFNVFAQNSNSNSSENPSEDSSSKNSIKVAPSTARPGEGGGKGIKDFTENFLQGLSDGFGALSNELEKRDFVELSGKVKVKGKGENLKITLKSTDKETYNLTTLSGSTDSLKKLALAKNQQIKATGVLNKETKVFVIVSYVLLDDDDGDEVKI